MSVGDNFTKIKSWAFYIEVALCMCALHLRPTFEKLFTGAKVWGKVQKIGVVQTISFGHRPNH